MTTMKEQRKVEILDALSLRVFDLALELGDLREAYNLNARPNMQIRERAQKVMFMADVFVNRFEDIFVTNGFDMDGSLYSKYKRRLCLLNDNMQFFL